MIPNFIRDYEASADIAAYRIAKFSDAANSSKIAQAAANNEPYAGTTGKLGAVSGEMSGLVKGGIGAVQLGGTVTAGAWLTSDASGKAIATVTAGHHVIGRAEQPGVADDIIDYFAAPGVRAA